MWFALVFVLALLSIAGTKQVLIQTVEAAEYAQKAADQRDRTIELPAVRGTIYDRSDTPLAFTVQGRAIAAWPALFTSDVDRRAVAEIIARIVPEADADEIFAKLIDGDSTYVYLARGLLPAQATAIMDEITTTIKPQGRHPVTTERQDLRQYPQGSALQVMVGATGWDGHGASGIEAKYDVYLSGQDGERTVDVDSAGRAMPGTARDEAPPVNGGDMRLTVDADLQYTVLQMVQSAVEESGALGGMAVVRSATSADVYAMVTYYEGKTAGEVGNMPITSPLEPGSVAKVIVFGAALDAGIITPEKHYAVPETIAMGGHIIHDAWPHARVGMSATGILAKSSNVGTLMIAQELGQDAFAAAIKDYGVGTKTGIELPAESAGLVPEQSQWSATSFANLPLGQGMSLTMVQIADMFQAIANDGLRIPSSIIAGHDDSGAQISQRRAPVQQMTKESANTLLQMLRGTVQDGNLLVSGTAPDAALTGYQVAGKTGTAQKVDPECGCYSKDDHIATFAGIVPADNPEFVVTVMLDAPADGAEGGDVAAPLFRDIAAYTLRAFGVAPSSEPAPIYDLYLNWGE